MKDPIWAWAKRLIKGHTHTPPPPPPEPNVTSPFSARRLGDTYEIADANGVVAIWCRGERVARMLLHMLNLCWAAETWRDGMMYGGTPRDAPRPARPKVVDVKNKCSAHYQETPRPM